MLRSSLLLIVTSLHKFWNYITSRNSSQRNWNKRTAVWNYILSDSFCPACVPVTLVPVIVTCITMWTERWTERRKNNWRKEWSESSAPVLQRRNNKLNELFNIARSDRFYFCFQVCPVELFSVHFYVSWVSESADTLIYSCYCELIWTASNTRVGTLIVATIYLQLIQNRYMFRTFTVLHCSHQHCVQPVASDVEVVGYL